MLLKPFGGQSRFSLEANLDAAHGLNGSFLLKGPMHKVRIPDKTPTPSFTDFLWKQTCFELFIRHKNGTYLEWNFSPSGHWACYEFSSYRKKKTKRDNIHPVIQTHGDGEQFSLEVSLSKVANPRDYQYGLSAVIITEEGSEFFAIDHFGQQPDFHDSRSHCYNIRPKP